MVLSTAQISCEREAGTGVETRSHDARSHQVLDELEAALPLPPVGDVPKPVIEAVDFGVAIEIHDQVRQAGERQYD